MGHCRFVAAVVVYALLASGCANAQPEHLLQPTNDLTRANELYVVGEYEAAANIYEALLTESLLCAATHYNLANSYMQMDDLGPAVLHYRRALLLAPRDKDILHNLAHAESRLAAQPSAEVESWTRVIVDQRLARVTINELTVSTVVFYWLAVGMAIWRIPNRRRLFSMLLGIFFLALCVCGGLTYAKWQRDYAGGKAIVLSDEEMHSGPGDEFEVLAHLAAGVEVKLVEAQGRYRQVRTEAGGQGWLDGNQVQLISPFAEN